MYCLLPCVTQTEASSCFFKDTWMLFQNRLYSLLPEPSLGAWTLPLRRASSDWTQQHAYCLCLGLDTYFYVELDQYKTTYYLNRQYCGKSFSLKSIISIIPPPCFWSNNPILLKKKSKQIILISFYGYVFFFSLFSKNVLDLPLFKFFSCLYFPIAICSFKFSQIVYSLSVPSIHLLAFGSPFMT